MAYSHIHPLSSAQPNRQPLRLLVVDDIKQLRSLFEQGLRKNFGAIRIDHAATLTEARQKLSDNTYNAVITDCGFPVHQEAVREDNNRSGIALIKELRKGHYGAHNAVIPVAFNSAEMTVEKSTLAQRQGGNTKVFKKGSLYGALTVGKARDNFTVGSVASETVKWLDAELTPEKISAREKAVEAAAQKQQASGQSWSFRSLFGGGGNTQRS